MKKYLTIFLATQIFCRLFSQQDPVVSQYMFNGLVLNPAYAGSKEYFSATLLHRSQWIGWEGAPRTQIFSFHTLLKDKINGLGLTVSNDHIGVTNQVDVYGNYAYHIRLDKMYSLALGAKAGMSFYRADLGKLVYWDGGDPSFQGDVRSNLLPNAGAGAYFYAPKGYAGFSVPHLLSFDPKELFSIGKNIRTIPKVRRSFYLTAGYAWELSKNIVLKPSFLLKYTPAKYLQADLNINMMINRVVWVGASFRTGKSIVGLFEIQLTKRFRLGYAYDYTFSNISDYTWGSHEIMLGYDFAYEIIRMKTPRYF